MTPIGIIQAYNIPVQLDRNPKEFGNWDGEYLNIYGMTVDGILHEIAHWLVCPIERKHIPDYALGAGPDTPFSLIKEKQQTLIWINVTGKEGNEEESLACVMEFILAVACGYDTPRMRTYLEDRYFIHNGRWDSDYGGSLDDFEKYITQLKKLDLISNNYWIPKGLKHLLSKEEKKRFLQFKQLVRSIP